MHFDGGCDHAGVKDEPVEEAFHAFKRELFNLAVTEGGFLQAGSYSKA
jgi:hypothetical protein